MCRCVCTCMWPAIQPRRWGGGGPGLGGGGGRCMPIGDAWGGAWRSLCPLLPLPDFCTYSGAQCCSLAGLTPGRSCFHVLAGKTWTGRVEWGGETWCCCHQEHHTSCTAMTTKVRHPPACLAAAGVGGSVGSTELCPPHCGGGQGVPHLGNHGNTAGVGLLAAEAALSLPAPLCPHAPFQAPPLDVLPVAKHTPPLPHIPTPYLPHPPGAGAGSCCQVRASGGQSGAAGQE